MLPKASLDARARQANQTQHERRAWRGEGDVRSATQRHLGDRRAILQRRSAVVQAERQLQMQGIELSLYLRLPDGRPDRPGDLRLPPLPAPAAPGAPAEADVAGVALDLRPELKSLRLKRAQQEAALRLAENGTLPTLDLFSEVARDVGSGASSRTGKDFEAGVVFQLPLQRRKATGKALQLRSKLAAIDQDLRWAEDEIRAEVQDALSALAAAGAVLDLVGEELAVARELEGLEREAKARADQQKALVAVEAATGRLLVTPPRP